MRAKVLTLWVLAACSATEAEAPAAAIAAGPSPIEVTGHPDALYLAAEADRQGVPRLVAWAIAYQESRHELAPDLRGHHCRGRPGCEVGRFQILPSTARLACRDLDVWKYSGNVACGLRYLRLLYEERGSWVAAVRAYQCPRCLRRTEYEQQVMATIGRFALGGVR